MKHAALKVLDREAGNAYRALLNDPAVKADPQATHTPELYAAWEAAADKCWNYREQHELRGQRGY